MTIEDFAKTDFDLPCGLLNPVTISKQVGMAVNNSIEALRKILLVLTYKI
jgi:hypothetical protein